MLFQSRARIPWADTQCWLSLGSCEYGCHLCCVLRRLMIDSTTSVLSTPSGSTFRLLAHATASAIPCAYDGRVRRMPISARKSVQSPSASKTISSNPCLCRRRKPIMGSRIECHNAPLYARRFFLALIFFIRSRVAFPSFFNTAFCSILTHSVKHSRLPNRTPERTLSLNCFLA